jgi:hypothetical protein
VGVLRYGTPPESIELDDRELAHLQIVILTKLRRKESTSVAVGYAAGAHHGRITFWISPAVPLQFKYFEANRPAIDLARLDQLMAEANSTDGVQLMPEIDTAARR